MSCRLAGTDMLESETAVSHGASRKVPNPKPSGK